MEFYWGLVFGLKNVLLLDNKTGCSSILLVNGKHVDVNRIFEGKYGGIEQEKW